MMQQVGKGAGHHMEKNESAPDSMSQGRSFEQPSPRSLLKDRLGWFVKIVNSTCVLARKWPQLGLVPERGYAPHPAR
jgi:hypothetical protein